MRCVLLALATVTAVSPRMAWPRAVREPAPVVVIDPGHGGEKDGAMGPGGAREKDLSLAIARRLRDHLRARAVRAELTRTRDVSVRLAARAARANAAGAEVFVSIHLNSMPGDARVAAHGVETYFLSADATDASASAVAARENADRLAGEPDLDPADPVAGILRDLADADSLSESSRLAYTVHERLVSTLGAPDRGVKQAPFYVLAGARMPAVLVEVGFLSHAAEARRLASAAYQDEVARALADGIVAWRAGRTRVAR